jgi:hypothetical protein
MSKSPIGRIGASPPADPAPVVPVSPPAPVAEASAVSFKDLPGQAVGTLHRVDSSGQDHPTQVFISKNRKNITLAGDSFESALNLAESRAAQKGAQLVALVEGSPVVAQLVDASGWSIQVDGPTVAGVFQSVELDAASNVALRAVSGQSGSREVTSDSSANLFDARELNGPAAGGLRVMGKEAQELLSQQAKDAQLPRALEPAAMRTHSFQTGSLRRAAFRTLLESVMEVAADPLSRERAVLEHPRAGWVSAPFGEGEQVPAHSIRAMRALLQAPVVARVNLQGVEINESWGEVLGLKAGTYSWGDLREALSEAISESRFRQINLHNAEMSSKKDLELAGQKLEKAWMGKGKLEARIQKNKDSLQALADERDAEAVNEVELQAMHDSLLSGLPEPLRFMDRQVGEKDGQMLTIPTNLEELHPVGTRYPEAVAQLKRLAQSDTKSVFGLLHGDSGMYWTTPLTWKEPSEQSAAKAGQGLSAMGIGGAVVPSSLDALHSRLMVREASQSHPAIAPTVLLGEALGHLREDPESRTRVIVAHNEQWLSVPMNGNVRLEDLGDLAALSRRLGLSVLAVVHRDGASLQASTSSKLGVSSGSHRWREIIEAAEKNALAVEQELGTVSARVAEYDRITHQSKEYIREWDRPLNGPLDSLNAFAHIPALLDKKRTIERVNQYAPSWKERQKEFQIQARGIRTALGELTLLVNQ